MKDDINDYLPSLLNPRGVRKQRGDLTLTLTQNSVISRCSLSLKKKNGISCERRALYKTFPTGKENEKNNNILKPTTSRNQSKDASFDVRSFSYSAVEDKPVLPLTKEIVRNSPNGKTLVNQKDIDELSIGFSAVDDINSGKQNIESTPFSFEDLETVQNNVKEKIKSDESICAVSSTTELNDDSQLNNTENTVVYEVIEKPVISVSFGVMNCETLNISSNSGNIKKLCLTRNDNDMDVDCEIVESSEMSVDAEPREPRPQADESSELRRPDPVPPKKSAVAVNIEIKKTNLTEPATENSKVLILNTDAIERLSHVIVQPPNYKLVKRQILNRNKFKNNGKRKLNFVRNGKSALCENLKQKKLDCYFGVRGEVTRSKVLVKHAEDRVGGCEDMSKNSGVADAVKCDRSGRYGGARREGGAGGSPRRGGGGARKAESPRSSAGVKVSASEQRGALRGRNDSASSAPSHRKNVDPALYGVAAKNNVNKPPIPHYKLVAGTHFAVDAFSYGDIPNVEHYFLTHFHSDHYSGLKRSFNKTLFCSQITSELCQTRLNVNPKYIRVINFDETITVEGVEVTAVDANHCPGALMLVFTLPNGKTLLHTGDFRASPQMESYPIFWNRDIHTIYLDSTYCNPRYDFPTQEESLEMALYHLRQKKLALEKAGKKFSAVLIVCGTYTIGKEKFFLGMARRVGCSVWACPEKDKVLRAVEGRSFCGAAPALCQLHVVPMRDLTHDKLRSYLESLEGEFTEVVAFKPSGWENGKNSSVEKDNVTIHGIPYSEHSSFSEMIRFVKFLKPKQVVPTVDISGGVKSVQKYFPCPVVCKEDTTNQSKVTDYFSILHRQQSSAVT